MHHRTRPIRVGFATLLLIGTFFNNSFSQVTLDKALVQQATGAAGVFLRMGVGARALGMGGAFSGIADDPSAAYWNPSGLAQIHNFQFEFMNVNLPFERTFNYFSAALPLKRFMTFAVSWVGFRVENLEARTSNSTEPDFLFNNTQNAFFFSIGTSVTHNFSIGGSAKFIRNELGSFTANGLGFDGSILFQPTDRLSLGLLLQDIGTDYRWEGGLTEGIPMTLRFGTAWKIFDGVILAADISKTTDESPQYHIGAEIRPVNSLPLRMGWNDGQITGGAGIVIPVSSHLMELNYGYTNDRIFNDVIHRVSLVFSLGEKSNMRYGRPNRSKTKSRAKRPSVSDLVRTTGKKIIITAKVLNVRTGPGTKYRKMAQIKYGQKFQGFERRGNWRKIKLGNGQMGWVHVKYIREVKK